MGSAENRRCAVAKVPGVWCGNGVRAGRYGDRNSGIWNTQFGGHDGGADASDWELDPWYWSAAIGNQHKKDQRPGVNGGISCGECEKGEGTF